MFFSCRVFWNIHCPYSSPSLSAILFYIGFPITLLIQVGAKHVYNVNRNSVNIVVTTVLRGASGVASLISVWGGGGGAYSYIRVLHN